MKVTINGQDVELHIEGDILVLDENVVLDENKNVILEATYDFNYVKISYWNKLKLKLKNLLKFIGGKKVC